MVSFRNTTSTGGDGVLGLRYVDNVAKYDPSSFYNWEQDNIPIWELEARENFLLQMAGFPGKNQTGVTMVLSSLGSETDGSDGVYDSIEHITERIPKKLKFPILIEICAFGNLGKLDLANITCEGEGKLEVVNRAFASDGDAAIGVHNTTTSSSPAGALNHIYQVSSYSVCSQISTYASSTRLKASLGENVVNWRTHSRWFAQNGPDTDHDTGRLSAMVASGSNGHFTNDVNEFRLYNYSQLHDYTITGLDAAPKSGSGIHALGGSDFLEGHRDDEILDNVTRASVLGYGNYFSAVNVRDCQGTIKLTNICADTGTGAGDSQAVTTHQLKHAFEVNGSEVILDNCTGMRARRAGFNFKDSDIKITGSWIGWRNYDKDAAATRGVYGDGAGVKAVNTSIEFESEAYTNSRKSMLNFTKNGRGMDLRNCTVFGGIKNKDTTNAGVTFLPNGGSSATAAMGFQKGSGGDTKTSILQTYGNTEYGIYCEGTSFEFDGRLDSFNNVKAGIYGLRSTFSSPQFTVKDNQGPGIHLLNSTFIYGTKSDEFAIPPDHYGCNIGKNGAHFLPSTSMNGGSQHLRRIRNRAQFHVDNNGQNILAEKNSTIMPYGQDDYPRYFGRWGGATWTADTIGTHSVSSTPMSHHGATPYRKNNLPGIQVNDNSVAEFTHLSYGVKADLDFAKGACAAAHNNSHITFRGSAHKTTALSYTPSGVEGALGNWDVNTAKRSYLCAGVYAANNSTVEFTGPTKISRFGVGALSENTSQIKVNPPTVNGTNNTLDVSGWQLVNAESRSVSGNHTSLEVHSTRACLVANRRSGIDLFAIGGMPLGISTQGDIHSGGVNQNSGATSWSTDVLASNVDSAYGDAYKLFSLATSGGHVKFYPNGFTSSIGNNAQVKLSDTDARPLDQTTNYVLPGYQNGTQKHSEGTTGGMCVRAVEGSYVDSNLVDYWYEGNSRDVSGAFYNVLGTGCEGLADDGVFGWNGPPEHGGGAGNEDPTPFGESTDDPRMFDNYGTIGGNNEGGGGMGGGGTVISTSRITGEAHKLGGATNHGGGNSGHTMIDVQTNVGSYPVDGVTGNPTWNNASGSGLWGTRTFYGAPGYQGGMAPKSWGAGGGENMSMGGMDDTKCYMQHGTPDSVSLTVGDGANFCLGSPIQIWNIADTSRVHAANSLINKGDPWVSCSGSNLHGPAGKWYNGVALDYYGYGGRMTSYGLLGREFHNFGIFRLMMGHRGDLKGYYEISALMCGKNPGLKTLWQSDAHGGTPMDQVNAAGYLTVTPNASSLVGSDQRRHAGVEMWSQGKYNMSGTEPIFGWGVPAFSALSGVSELPTEISVHKSYYVSGNGAGIFLEGTSGYSENQTSPEFPIPPINMDWQGYMRNFLDESSSNLFQNAKHMASKRINGVSIYRSHQDGQSGGEGRDGVTCSPSDPTGQKYGVGVRSLNLFDMDRLL